MQTENIVYKKRNLYTPDTKSLKATLKEKTIFKVPLLVTNQSTIQREKVEVTKTTEIFETQARTLEK